jgi:hypothetical protein
LQRFVAKEGIFAIATYWEMSRKHNWPQLPGYPTDSRCSSSLYRQITIRYVSAVWR